MPILSALEARLLPFAVSVKLPYDASSFKLGRPPNHHRGGYARIEILSDQLANYI